MGPWIFGTAMGLLGLLGLFMASYATDAVFHGTGLGLFVFGVLVIGWLIRRGTKPRGEEA
jgi:hypothetical protein